MKPLMFLRNIFLWIVLKVTAGFYNIITGEVIDLSLGQDLIDFAQGKLKPQWSNFNQFVEIYFDLS